MDIVSRFMRLRRTLPALVTVVALVAPQSASADLGDVLPASILDPAIAILPPRPVPYHAYTGPICVDGDRSCIDRTIRRMQRRLAVDAAECDHDAIFGLAYLRVTQDVRRALDAGWFDDRIWLSQVDALFAKYYFDTMDNWHSGNRAAVPQAWKIALKAADEESMTGLGNFMLAMNAHINRDFSYVLARVGLVARDGTSHKKDHNAYNPRLDGLMDPVFSEEAARFDPSFDDLNLAGLDATVAGIIMRGWREMVWRHAEDLVLAKTPLEKALARANIESYAAMQAQLIRQMFASPSPAKRDAWCATHG